MMHSWDVSADLRKQTSRLPPNLKFLVRRAMDDIREKPEIGKSLEEDLAGYRSYRIGKYRLIYRITEDRLVLEAVGPRSDIYERFVLEIGRQKIRERNEKYAARAKQKSKKTSRISLRPSLRRVRTKV